MSAAEIKAFEQAAAEPAVRGFLHLPARPSGDGVVLTHGAGSNCRSPLIAQLAAALCDDGFTVLRCDLPFRQSQAQGPPPRGSAEIDQQGLRRAIEALRGEADGRIFLSGHSYGGRQGSMLAASHAGFIAGLLLLSYPLHPPNRPGELRTAHFAGLQTPALFVHGSRDPFGSLDELATAIELIPSRAELLPIAGAGHDLLMSKNRRELPKSIAEKFREFVALRA